MPSVDERPMTEAARQVAWGSLTWQEVPLCGVSGLAGYECAHCLGLPKADDPPLMPRW